MLFKLLAWTIQWLLEPFIEMRKWKKAEFGLGEDDNLILKRLGLLQYLWAVRGEIQLGWNPKVWSFHERDVGWRWENPQTSRPEKRKYSESWSVSVPSVKTDM